MKTKRVYIVLFVVLISIVGAVGWGVLRTPSEPRYHGKPVSAWAEAFYRQTGTEFTSSRGGEAAEAIHEIGTNAVPTLLRMARSEDSRLKLTLVFFAQKQSLVPIHFTPSFMRQQRAAGGFEALGVLAEGAIPELARLVNDPNHAEGAADSLAGISPKALQPLLNALTNQNATVRASVAGALGHGFASSRVEPGSVAPLGSNATVAIAALIVCAKDADTDVRQPAIKALGRIGQEPELVVPALIENLQDTFPNCRLLAAESLGRFGKDARMAIPALLQAANDTDANIQSFVKWALVKIDPEAAAKAGVK